MNIKIDIEQSSKSEINLITKINKLVGEHFKVDSQVFNATDKWIIQEN